MNFFVPPTPMMLRGIAAWLLGFVPAPLLYPVIRYALTASPIVPVTPFQASALFVPGASGS